MQHTPGPWKVRPILSGVDYVVIDKQKQIVARVLLNSSDAHLVSSAPDMFKALVACRKQYECNGHTEEEMAFIDDALAKARGVK